MRLVLWLVSPVLFLALPRPLGGQTAVPCAAPVGSAPAPAVSAAPPNLDVTWKKVPRAAGYDVFRRNPDGSCLQLTPQGTTLTSVQDPIPAILGVYHYQVGVRTGAGMSSTELSHWTAYDVAAAGGAPATGSAPAPTGLTATGTPTTATLTWVAPKGAINYRVNRAVAGTTVWNSLTPMPISATTLGNDVLPDPTLAYTYAVLAYQRNGQFGEARLNFRAPPPTNPTGLTGSASGSTVTIAWQPVRYAAGYLVTGPGVTGTARIASTSYSIPGVADGANVYRVGAVFDPGAVQTAASLWPAVTVTVQAQPILTCACTATGPFQFPTGRTVVGIGPQGPFTHPTAGTFTLTAQLIPPATGAAQLDVYDAQGQTVLTEGQVFNWHLSPDNRFFAVIYPPTSTNSGAPASVYLVQRGPARWPKLIDAVAWPDGYWGFGANSIFLIVRHQYPHTFSFEAYDLLSPTPMTSVLRVSETNVMPAQPQAITFSPCGDRLMYLRYSSIANQADFYRRTAFGRTQAPVIADYDASLPGTPWPPYGPGAGIAAGLASNSFMVVLSALRERTTGQTNFPSIQCTP